MYCIHYIQHNVVCIVNVARFALTVLLFALYGPKYSIGGCMYVRTQCIEIHSFMP